MGMLLCLDRKQRLIFPLGEILGGGQSGRVIRSMIF